MGQQPPPARSTGGQVPLLVLALVTAVLGILGAFLPSYSYGDGLGSSAPLFQRFDDDTTFQATGLALVAGTALLVVGGLLLLVLAGLTGTATALVDLACGRRT